MNIPLYNRLRRQLHRDIGSMQDEIVEIIYSIDETAVLHGGTAIWRCYQGNRFSEDLDFYIAPARQFKDSFAKMVGSVDLQLVKYKETKNAIYSKIVRGNVTVAFEAALRKFAKPAIKEYEKIDGSYIDVFVPSTEELLIEKLEAYKNRKLIRDIYDVFHLSKFVEAQPVQNSRISKLLLGLPLPLDEKNLKNLVIVGAVPTYAQITQALKRRFS